MFVVTTVATVVVVDVDVVVVVGALESVHKTVASVRGKDFSADGEVRGSDQTLVAVQVLQVCSFGQITHVHSHVVQTFPLERNAIHTLNSVRTQPVYGLQTVFVSSQSFAPAVDGSMRASDDSQHGRI